MIEPTESYIVCEGNHELNFLAGLLITSRQCKKANPQVDPWGKKVERHWAFVSQTGHFLRVVDAGGKGNDLKLVRRRLENRKTENVRQIVVCRDPDTDIETTESTGLRIEALHSLARNFDNNAQISSEGDVTLDQGQTIISLLRWEVPHDSIPGVPSVQLLERLICAAIVRAYPERGEPVEKWLRSISDSPSPKSFGWSYMAGWYPDMGCHRFLVDLWEDPKISTELEKILTSTGAWRIMGMLTNAEG